jgi:hypothetical protein
MTTITLTVSLTASGFTSPQSDQSERVINIESRKRAERRWRARMRRFRATQPVSESPVANFDSLDLKPFEPTVPSADLSRAAVLRAVRRLHLYTVGEVVRHTRLPRAEAKDLLETLAEEGLICKASRPVPCSSTRQTLYTPKD